MYNPFYNFLDEERESANKYLLRTNGAHIKRYPRVKNVQLPKPGRVEAALSTVITNRISENDFSTTYSLSSDDVSALLHWSVGELGIRKSGQEAERNEKNFRAHPSGGSLFPIETYVYLRELDENGPGLYHYRPDLHSLECIKDLSRKEAELFFSGFSYSFVEQAPCVMLLSHVVEHNIGKYGNFAYKLALLEAGHIGQNIYLSAAGLSLMCNALGAVRQQNIAELLDIDGYNESVIYAIALGRKS